MVVAFADHGRTIARRSLSVEVQQQLLLQEDHDGNASSADQSLDCAAPRLGVLRLEQTAQADPMAVLGGTCERASDRERERFGCDCLGDPQYLSPAKKRTRTNETS